METPNKDKIEDTNQLVDNHLNLYPPYICEKYIYYYDFPTLKENGYVEICNDIIIIKFPEKPPSFVNHMNQNNVHTNVQLFLNTKLVFDYQWLPIYTFQDHIRSNSILQKAVEEYMRLTHFNFSIDNYNSNNFYDERKSIHDYKHFYLQCLETKHLTSIELELRSPNVMYCDNVPIQLQLYIGNNPIFCTLRDLKCLDNTSLQFVVCFILNKLIKY